MKKYKFLILLFCVTVIQYVSAQEVLPGITVKDFNGKIIVSWQNAYRIPVTNISIQRSFDSTKNFSSIGTVLNPQNLENGFADDNPPYNKMFYRVFISFEGGTYIFSSTVRPVREVPLRKETVITHVYTPEPDPDDAIAVKIDDTGRMKNIDTIIQKTIIVPGNNVNVPSFPWQESAIKDSTAKTSPGGKKADIPVKNNPEIITYPSLRIFTGRENNVVIYLRDAIYKKYSVKFFDENHNFLFEITKLREEYLVVEKVNFVHSGWFHFELAENGKLVEKNKFFIAKDGKNNNSEFNKRENR